MLLDGDRLIASSSGNLYCLDALTGKILWHNPMKGYGMAIPMVLGSVRGQAKALIEEMAAHQQVAVAAMASS